MLMMSAKMQRMSEDIEDRKTYVIHLAKYHWVVLLVEEEEQYWRIDRNRGWLNKGKAQAR